MPWRPRTRPVVPERPVRRARAIRLDVISGRGRRAETRQPPRWRSLPRWVGLGLGFIGLAAATATGRARLPTSLTIDAARSEVFIDVGRTGLFGFAGHEHEIRAAAVVGRVVYDPDDWAHSTVALEFDVNALEVTGKGDPPADVPKVREVMLSDRVLDAKRFPSVGFQSHRVSVAATGQALGLVIDGDLTLHGVTRPLSVHADARLDSEGLTVSGDFPIRQTDFGIKPVTGAGGTVRVKDQLNVRFVLRARRPAEAWPGPPAPNQSLPSGRRPEP